jgi:hypothetical protein
MREVKAREILSKYDLDFSIKARVMKLDGIIDGSQAKGYLEAIEKAKMLADGLSKIERECSENDAGGVGHCHCSCAQAGEILAKWEVER